MNSKKLPKPKFCKICGVEHRNIGSTCGRMQCEKTRKERKAEFRKEIRESGESIVASLALSSRIGIPKIKIVDTAPEQEGQEKERKPKAKKCKVCEASHYNFGSTCGRPQCEATRKAEKEKNKKNLFARPSEMVEVDELALKRKIPDMKKNTVREVTTETKQIVFDRDGGQCVIGRLFPELQVQCNELEGVPHHVFFGSESNY